MGKGGVLVTGSGRGIGAATALLLAKRGYDVCINYVGNAAAAKDVARQCEKVGANVITVQADIAKEADILALFKACDDAFSHLAGLVNNAGILGKATKLVDLDAATLDRVTQVNIKGAILCAREAVRRMSSAQGGRGGSIVNISSIAATLGSPGEYVHYAASKAALDAFTVGLAKEVGPEGVRVNAIQAGTVDTSIHYESGNPDRPAMVAATAPLRRTGEAGDIAEAVSWLLSYKASYVTGAILRVGGGL